MPRGYSSGTDVNEVNGKQEQRIVPTLNTDGETKASAGNHPLILKQMDIHGERTKINSCATLTK